MINRNLEALAKQLYDYWFVQFDFPDENGWPYKSSGGKMVWNEDIQMSIPFGWNVCRLSDFIGKNNTGDWGTDEPSGNSIEIGCIRGADILSLNDLPKRYIKSNKVEKLLTEWDVVIEVSGGSPVQATGRSAYITPGVIKRNGGNISCSNFCHAFSFKDYRDSAYFFYVWNMFYDNGIMFNYEGKTSGIKNFMTDVFLANKWINAPKTLIVKFYNVIKEIYAKMDANISENNSLVKQRDELLPLLMNGQVEVKQLNSDFRDDSSHPDMQCRVFIIRRMTMIGRSHRSHAAAHASVGMTRLLNSAAATDARQCTSKCHPAKAAEPRPLSSGQAAAGRPEDALTGHGSPRFCPLRASRFGHGRALH